jgi:hypothetical protein
MEYIPPNLKLIHSEIKQTTKISTCIDLKNMQEVIVKHDHLDHMCRKIGRDPCDPFFLTNKISMILIDEDGKEEVYTHGHSCNQNILVDPL